MFRILPIRTNFSDSRNFFFQFYLFPTNFDFHPPTFMMTFFQSSTTEFRIPPLFSLIFNFSSLFRENYYFLPTFTNFPLFSENLRVFYILYVYFVPPTLAMMHCCITQYTYWTTLRQ